jgi:GntR family transcriptional regulator
MVAVKFTIIVAMAVVMMPHWNIQNVLRPLDNWNFIRDVLVTLPFALFSILYVQILNPMNIVYRKLESDPRVAAYRIIRANRIAYGVLVVSVLFFACSFAFTISQADARYALEHNVSALAIVARVMPGIWVKVMSVVLDMFAILSAFSGIYLGFHEAVRGIVLNLLGRFVRRESLYKSVVNVGVAAAIVATLWVWVSANFSTMLILQITGPIYGITSCLVPCYLIWRVPSLRNLRGWPVYFVSFYGLLLMVSPARPAATVGRNQKSTAIASGAATVQGDARLNRDSATALYTQIADLLRADIDAGTFANDSKLPGENELTRRFSVSRVTVRQAIAQLLTEGYVISKQGKGTFVSRQKFLHDLKPMRGFYDALVAQGVEPKTRLLEFGPASLPAPLKEAFGSPENDCFRLRRVYLVDEEPIALVESFLPPEASGLIWEQVTRNPICVLLEGLLGLQVSKAEIRIRARTAGTSVGQVLGLTSRAALLVMERESFGNNGTLREHTTFYIRPDNYEFTLSVQGPLPVGSSIKNINGTSPLERTN